MKPWHALLLVSLLPAACADLRVDVSTMPPNFYGTGVDTDSTAAYQEAQAFAAGRTRPTDTPTLLRAVLAVEFLAGEYNTAGRYGRINDFAQIYSLDARLEMRKALGVAPGTRSQVVVNALVAASRAADANDMAAAARALDVPAFTLGGAGTLDRLRNLPDLPRTRDAITWAARGDVGYTRIR